MQVRVDRLEMPDEASDRAATDRRVAHHPSARDFGPELDVLRLGSDPHLAGLLPRMSFDLRSTPTVVTDIVDGLPATEYIGSQAAPDPEVAAAIGSAIGAWHLGAQRYARQFRAAADRPAAGVSGIGAVGSALAELGNSWTPSTVIHGDCRAANAVVTAEPNGCGNARVVLTGWRRSGLGDPAWDLGCLVADLMVAGRAALAASSAEPAVSACLAAYGRAAGTPAPSSDFARRVALSIVARLVSVGTNDTVDEELLGSAASVAAALPAWTREIQRWLG
jgi:hypothetical protein